MNIHINKIQFKNFRSYGNKEHTIEFKAGVDIVTGQNGAGKTSAFVHSIVYALYGVGVYGEKLDELLNKHNREQMVCTLDLNKGHTNYVITRGRNPNILKVKINSEEKMFNSTKEAEDFIFRDILEELTIQSFCTLFIIQASNPSFSIFRMNKAQRRQIIENLFDLDDYINMQLNVKNDLSGLEDNYKKDLDILNSKKVEYKTWLQKHNIFLEEEKNFVKNKNINIDNLKKELEIKGKSILVETDFNKVNSETNMIQKEVDILKNHHNIAKKMIDDFEVIRAFLNENRDIKRDFEECDKDLKKAENRLEELKTSNSVLQSKKIIFDKISERSQNIFDTECDKEVCPLLSYFKRAKDTLDNPELVKEISLLTNGVMLKRDMRDKKLKILTEFDINLKKYNEIKPRIEKFKSIYTDLETILKKIDDLNRVLKSKNEIINNHNISVKEVDRINNEIKRLSDIKKPKPIITEDELKAMENKILIDENILKESKKNIDVMTELNNFLKKDSIKNFKIKSSFPVLKKFINDILKTFFDGNIKVEFLSDLDPVIYRGGSEVSYNSFSGGEKKRLDLAFLFAIRNFIMSKNNFNSNILIMDELLDSDLDEKGIRMVFEYLNSLKNTNTILITHRHTDVESNRVFNLVKDKKFSQIMVK